MIDDKKVGLNQFFLSKEVQAIYNEHGAQLGRIFKQRAEFIQKFENRQVVDIFKLQKPEYVEIFKERGLETQNVFDEESLDGGLTFEEFKRSLIKVSLLYLPTERRQNEPYGLMLKRRLIGSN